MLRPDKVVPALQGFVSATLGARFTEPPPFDLAGSYRESSATSPLLFVLSTGSDPTAALLQVWGTVKCGEVCVGGVSESSVSPDRLLYLCGCACGVSVDKCGKCLSGGEILKAAERLVPGAAPPVLTLCSCSC